MNRLNCIPTLILSLVLLFMPAISDAQKRDISVQEAMGKYGQVLYFINNYYLDTTNVNRLLDKAILETINQLDPHSSYLTAAEVKAANEPLEAEFDGIGVEFALIRDTLTVQAPIVGGPSERVGIIPGDKIIKVNGENIAGIGLTNEKVHKYLRGPKGTRVAVSIKREGVKDPLDFTIVRDKIPLFSMDAVYEPKPGILYMKLSRFSSTSANELEKALLSGDTKPKGVILDLRGNSGGYLYASLLIANQFLNKGEIILYTEGRTVPRMNEFANGEGLYRDGALIVLIDENSASASEIVAGAIQDWDRGLVIGRRSFGKGLVQQMMPLSDGSQLRLTISRYHTPSGRVIQSPYEEGNKRKYYEDFYRRYEKGENLDATSIAFPDSLKFKTLKEGRTVFGGGGIMPDIFVPQDTTYFSNYYSELIRKGIVLDFANNQIDKNRKDWSAEYTDFDKFYSKFSISDKLFEALITYAQEKGVPRNDKEIAISGAEIKTYLKALIAKSLFTIDAYFKVINREGDPVFAKAMEEMEKMINY